MIFYNEKIFKRCFDWKGKYWYKNIKEIPLYFRLMHHLIKHGYDEYATWETFDWFIDTMKEILTYYRNNHKGYPIPSLSDNMSDEEYAEQFDKDLDKMISLLDNMDENNEKYDIYIDDSNPDKIFTAWEEQEKAKDEFFKLFSKHFYSLWD